MVRGLGSIEPGLKLLMHHKPPGAICFQLLSGDFPGGPWLALHTSTAEGTLGQGTKILHATHHSQKQTNKHPNKPTNPLLSDPITLYLNL